jgi:tetratricopeptide (TPR) repeat protein
MWGNMTKFDESREIKKQEKIELDLKDANNCYNKAHALLNIALSLQPKVNSFDSDEDEYVEPFPIVTEKYQEALVTYEKYVQINPRDAVAWREKASCLSFLGRFEEALNDIEKAIVIKPDEFFIWNIKWLCLYRLGRMDEADQVWKIMNELGKKGGEGNRE